MLDRKNRRNTWKAFLGIFVASLLVDLAQPAEAGWCGQTSDRCPCGCVSTLRVPGLGDIGLSLSGFMKVDLIATAETNGICTASYASTDFSVSGHHVLLGNISIRIDPSRAAPAGDLVNALPFTSFPATHEVFAHALVEISSMPGKVFRTQNPFHMKSNSIMTFGSDQIEIYELSEPVNLEDAENPGAVYATLLEATIQVGSIPPEGFLHFADFESGRTGWTTGMDSCTAGFFELGTPDEVSSGGVTTQPAGPATGSGAFYTASNTSGAGSDDVDGGVCEALSPMVDASTESAVEISLDYFHGQRNAGDDPGDGFTVEVLDNGQVVDSLVAIDDVTHDAVWTHVSTTLVNPGNVQLRVRVTDAAGAGDLVEGGIDNVQIRGVGVCMVDEDFESGSAAGWSTQAGSTCTAGDFAIGNPTLQTNGGITTQAGGSSSGTHSLFTATNSSAGVDDVDGGSCVLESPTWSVNAASTLSVAYFHGQRDAGDDPGDFFLLEVSTDDGSSWQVLASNGDSTSNAQWSTATTPIAAGSNVRLRVQCSDGAGPGDLVECGIDDVSICE